MNEYHLLWKAFLNHQGGLDIPPLNFHGPLGMLLLCSTLTMLQLLKTIFHASFHSSNPFRVESLERGRARGEP